MGSEVFDGYSHPMLYVNNLSRAPKAEALALFLSGIPKETHLDLSKLAVAIRNLATFCRLPSRRL